jgi:hypothetical protein
MRKLWLCSIVVPALTALFTLRPERLWFGGPKPPALIALFTLRPERLWFGGPKPPALIALFTFRPVVVVLVFMIVISLILLLEFFSVNASRNCSDRAIATATKASQIFRRFGDASVAQL